MHERVAADLPSKTPCRLAFVGEAPSDEELEKGRPFVGPAGRVFNALVRSAGVNRYDHLVTNVFDQQLPWNDVSHWCAPAEERKTWEGYDLPPIGSAGYLRPEHLHHLDRLRRELEQVRPAVIVPLGGTALWALTGSAEIGTARGHVAEASRLLPGAKLLPTYHPSFVQKQWKMFVVVMGDIEKAMKESAHRGVRYTKRSFLIEPTLAEFRDYTNDVLLKAPIVSEDIETGWGQITCVGFAASRHEGICVPFVDLRQPNRSYWQKPHEEIAAWKLVAKINAANPPLKLGQNFTYDVYWFLTKMGMKVNGYAHDTRLIHHALYPELPKDLGFMAARYESVPPWKTWRDKKAEKRDD